MRPRPQTIAVAILVYLSMFGSVQARIIWPARLIPIDEPIGNAKPKKHIEKPVTIVKSTPEPASSAPAARIGQVYRLHGGDNDLMFTLNSLETTEGRYRLGDHDSELPLANEKLLLVHFSLRNPYHVDVAVDGDSIRLYAFAADRKTYQDVTNAVNEDTGELIDGTLPAGTQVNVVKVVHVPAHGPVLFLRVSPSPAGFEPFRFAISDRVARLKMPFVDPSDPTGMTALEPTPGVLGDTYAVGDYDVTLDKAQYTEDPMLCYAGSLPPLTGYHFAVFTFQVSGESAVGGTFSTDNFNPVLTTADGLALDPASAPLLNGIDDEAFDGSLQYGDTKHFRIYYPVNKHDTLATLTMQASSISHQYSYNLKSLLPSGSGS